MPRVHADYRAALREDYDAIQSSNRTKFWKPRKVTAKNDDGDRIRIISPPYMEPDPDFGVVLNPWVKFRTYRIPGVGGKMRMTVVPSDFRQPDPIAEWISDMEEGTKADRAAAKSMQPRQKFIALIVDLENNPNEVQPWEFGKQVAEQILKYATHRDYNLPWDNEEGHDLWVKCTGEGLDTEYNIIPSPRPTPLENAEEILALANKIDLAKFVTIETNETLEDMLDGKYDLESARESRNRRDRLHGRPFPYFLKSSERDNEDDEPAEQQTSARASRGSRRAPVEKDNEPAPKRERDEKESKPATSRRRRAPEPKDEPEQTEPQIGSSVRFQGDDGPMQGTITELHLDDSNPYVTVDTGDGDPWDVNVSEIEIVASEPEPNAEEEKRARRRQRDKARRESKKESGDSPARRARPADKNSEDDDGGVNKDSIVNRVSRLSQDARGER